MKIKKMKSLNVLNLKLKQLLKRLTIQTNKLLLLMDIMYEDMPQNLSEQYEIYKEKE